MCVQTTCARAPVPCFLNVGQSNNGLKGFASVGSAVWAQRATVTPSSLDAPLDVSVGPLITSAFVLDTTARAYF
jgi:hypothetical protein